MPSIVRSSKEFRVRNDLTEDITLALRLFFCSSLRLKHHLALVEPVQFYNWFSLFVQPLKGLHNDIRGPAIAEEGRILHVADPAGR